MRVQHGNCQKTNIPATRLKPRTGRLVQKKKATEPQKDDLFKKYEKSSRELGILATGAHGKKRGIALKKSVNGTYGDCTLYRAIKDVRTSNAHYTLCKKRETGGKTTARLRNSLQLWPKTKPRKPVRSEKESD